MLRIHQLVCSCYLISGLVAPCMVLGAQSNTSSRNGVLVRSQGPEELRFDDLVGLAMTDPVPAELQAKLDRVLNQPFVSNEATFTGVKPHAPVVPGVGTVLRVAEWNINRTTRLEDLKLALTDKKGFLAAAYKNSKLNAADIRKATDQVEHLQAADLIVLDEIDDGVARMGYENVPRELASALHMNYAFGVEFIELNGIFVHRTDGRTTEAASKDNQTFGDDPGLDRGMEGTAMLSRYPIRDAKIVRLPSEYDWYHDEIKALTATQKVEKWSSEKLFNERIRRQVRRGGRIALVVNLEVPQSPTGVITVVCPHLEDYTDPRGRKVQSDYLLRQLASFSNPVVVAGDFNTMGHNAHPHGFLKALTNFHFWLTQALFFAAPLPGVGYVLYPINFFKNSHDPTAANIPVLAPNPEEPLFRAVREFRFTDGGKLLWNGEKDRSYGHRGRTLADSNQRARKGFAPTFFFAKTFHGLIGESKIDWFFVKPLDNEWRPVGGWFPLAPFFGRTLPAINTAPEERISDHCPSTVDLLLSPATSSEASSPR